MAVLPPFSCVGDVVQVPAVTVVQTLLTRPLATPPPWECMVGQH